MADTTFQPATTVPHSKQAIHQRTDLGTIILHWLTCITMIASLLTGLRISADNVDSKWARLLAPYLPQGEIWTWHIIAGLILAGTITAYWIYLRRAVLGNRNAPARLKTLTPPTNKKLRLRALNVALHWFAYGAVGLLTATGIALYLGYGQWFLTLHNAFAWAMLFYIAIHSLAHFLYGGLEQLLRLFRASPLAVNNRTLAWPLGIALSGAFIAMTLIAALDWVSRTTLRPAIISDPPVLDGMLNELVWQKAKSVFIDTHQGANLGGTGTSQVEIKSAVTEDQMYLAFTWQDPTRSLMRNPLIKRQDGWHVLSTGAARADVNDYYEDKFAVLFSHNDGFGGGETTFMGDNPLPHYPKSPHGRGLHYTADGRLLDLWQWKSTRGGMLGHMDDMYFGPPLQPNASQKIGKKRYAAGYEADPGTKIYEYNYIADGPRGYDSPVRIKRLPIDLAEQNFRLGNIPKSANGSNDEGSQWWMTRENSIKWSASLDQYIPIGTILPSTLNIHPYSGDRADLLAGARWNDGKWTLEVSRKRHTGSPYDISFHPGQRIYLWVSVFDHNQTRHTRHQRSVILDLP